MVDVYRCPECHHETVAVSDAGREIVARYCLRHRTGLEGRLQPVEMQLCRAPEAAETLVREPVPVG